MGVFHRGVRAQVPELRDALLNRGDWRTIGQTQLATVFADTAENLQRHKTKMNDLMKNFDFMGMMQGVRALPHAHPNPNPNSPAVHACIRKKSWSCPRSDCPRPDVSVSPQIPVSCSSSRKLNVGPEHMVVKPQGGSTGLRTRD